MDKEESILLIQVLTKIGKEIEGFRMQLLKKLDKGTEWSVVDLLMGTIYIFFIVWVCTGIVKCTWS